MTPDSIALDRSATLAEAAEVADALLVFNEKVLGPSREEPVRIVAKRSGHIVGGLVGHTRWRWLYVSKLWVAEDARRLGLGSRLMREAEALARERGCTNAYLDTFEYQARPFYEKLGYGLFGTLEGYPPGYRQYFLTKAL